MRRLPAQHLAGTTRVRDEHGRVAGPSRPNAVRDRPSGRGLGRCQHLADAEAAAVPQVESEGRRVAVGSGRAHVVGRGRLEGEQVGPGEILDVDVVADAGAVRRG